MGQKVDGVIGLTMPGAEHAMPVSTIGQLSQQSQFASELAKVPVSKNAYDHEGGGASASKTDAKPR